MLVLLLAVVLLPTLVTSGKSFYDLSAVDIEGKPVNFDAFRGKVVLVVNVASECGFTDDHYRRMQRAFNILGQDDHFIILGFPCNQFGAQEPSSNPDIMEFVKEKYDVTFPMFEKVDVIGPNASPVWKFLTGKSGVSPDWNFYKYLIDHKGEIIEVFPSRTSMQSAFDVISRAVKKAKKASSSKNKKTKSVKKELKDEL